MRRTFLKHLSRIHLVQLVLFFVLLPILNTFAFAAAYYVDFDAGWWSEFKKGTGRAWATVTTPREITEERMSKWIEHQVAAALSVLHDIKPEGYFDDLIRLGRVKRRGAKRYRSLLSAGKPDSDLQNEGRST